MQTRFGSTMPCAGEPMRRRPPDRPASCGPTGRRRVDEVSCRSRSSPGNWAGARHSRGWRGTGPRDQSPLSRRNGPPCGMHDQRQALSRAPERHGQVGGDGEPVAGGVADRLDRRERLAVEAGIRAWRSRAARRGAVEEIIVPGSEAPVDQTTMRLSAASRETIRLTRSGIALSSRAWIFFMSGSSQRMRSRSSIYSTESIAPVRRESVGVLDVHLGMLEDRLADRVGDEIVAIDAVAAGRLVRERIALVAARDRDQRSMSKRVLVGCDLPVMRRKSPSSFSR